MTTVTHHCDRCHRTVSENLVKLQTIAAPRHYRRESLELCEDCSVQLENFLRAGATAEQFQLAGAMP